MTKEQLVNFMEWLDSKGYVKDFCTDHDFIAQVYLDQRGDAMNDIKIR
jgi:hypothetical protein